MNVFVCRLYSMVLSKSGVEPAMIDWEGDFDVNVNNMTH